MLWLQAPTCPKRPNPPWNVLGRCKQKQHERNSIHGAETKLKSDWIPIHLSALKLNALHNIHASGAGTTSRTGLVPQRWDRSKSEAKAEYIKNNHVTIKNCTHNIEPHGAVHTLVETLCTAQSLRRCTRSGVPLNVQWALTHPMKTNLGQSSRAFRAQFYRMKCAAALETCCRVVLMWQRLPKQARPLRDPLPL